MMKMYSNQAKPNQICSRQQLEQLIWLLYFAGYKHMCRFQSILIYQQPIIAELEYKFRLDDDSLVTSLIEYDIFR